MESISQIIKHGESEAVEFKKSTGLLREGIETICAFANHKGSYLIFGMEDDGTVIGQQISDDTIKNVANAVNLNTEPKLYPTIETVKIDNKDCLLITIEESPLKPHLAYGKAFIRVGASNQRLDRDRYEYLLQQRYNGYGFDHLVRNDANLDDIDGEAVYDFLEVANSVRSFNENLFLGVDVILQKLDLMKEGKLTNAALLLFGTEPLKFFCNHFEIKCGDFFQDSGYKEIVNDQEYNDNLITNFKTSLSFILKSIQKRSAKQDVNRIESYELPVSVIRDALVNMIVHRDYRQNIKSTVEIRPSIISFYNPAQLFEPTINIERLSKVHPSRPGNKLIAKIFYLMGLFENWGGGTLHIISETIKSGKKSPVFSFEDGMFRLELCR